MCGLIILENQCTFSCFVMSSFVLFCLNFQMVNFSLCITRNLQICFIMHFFNKFMIRLPYRSLPLAVRLFVNPASSVAYTIINGVVYSPESQGLPIYKHFRGTLQHLKLLCTNCRNIPITNYRYTLHRCNLH